MFKNGFARVEIGQDVLSQNEKSQVDTDIFNTTDSFLEINEIIPIIPIYLQ